jgi:hypothetical protein
MGLDVGHERPGKDGISSFQYAVDTDRVPFHSVDQNRGRKWYDFDRIIHVVRNPAHVIASAAFTDMNGAIEWQAKFVDVDLKANPVRQAVQTWIGWNRLIEEYTMERVRVEDAEEQLPKMMGETVIADPPLPVVNARPHPMLTWSEIRKECRPDEFHDLWEMAERYGYEA